MRVCIEAGSVYTCRLYLRMYASAILPVVCAFGLCSFCRCQHGGVGIMNGFLKFMFQNSRCYILKNGTIFERIRNIIRCLYFIFNEICSLFKYIFLNLLTKSRFSLK